MRYSIPISCLLSTLMAAPLVAQTPKPATPNPPATQPTPTQPPVRRRPVASSTPVTVTLTVYDKTGSPIGDTAVSLSGAGADAPREARTTAGGIARFLTVKPGDYRARFDHEGFVSYERDITVKGGAPLEMEITLTPIPTAPAPKAPEPVAATNTAPAGDARSLTIVDFIEKNGIRGGDPVKTDQLGCTASAKTMLLQIRDQVPEQSRADADETIYVVAGEGSLRLGNRDVPLQASTVAVIPRGTVRGISRKGKNVLYVLSVVSGPPCTK